MLQALFGQLVAALPSLCQLLQTSLHSGKEQCHVHQPNQMLLSWAR